MPNFRWVHPDFQELVAQHALDDLDAVLDREDGEPIMPGHRRRDTLRLDLGAGDGIRRRFYLKREGAVRWKHPLRSLATGRGLWTPVRAEFETLARLAAGGVLCPRPVVCLQRLFPRPRGALLLEALPESQTLVSFLSGPLRQASPGRRESFFSRLGRELARLHACGVSHPHVYANRIRVVGNLDDCRIAFLGFRRAMRLGEVGFSRRAADLAALVATLSRRLAGGDDRQAVLDGYLAAAALEHRGMELAAAVARREQRLLTQRKIWEIRESDTDEHRALRPLESLQRGKMWIDRAYRSALESAGVSNFEAMLATTAGREMRALPDRENWRMELPACGEVDPARGEVDPACGEGDPAPRTCGAYLKKHHVRTFGSWLRAKTGAGPGASAGRVEAQNVARLARSGIAAMRLIAYGEKLGADGLLESFVLTEELVGFTQLDHFLAERFPPRERSRPTPRDPDLLRLIDDVAAVARKFHRLGYNHRDLYCCHFFIKECGPGDYKINLIDLQRVQHRRRLRGRWIVKDLAQLAYSTPRDRISCTQKMRFAKRYLGVKKLRPQDKRLLRMVLAKQRLMERTLGVAA